MCSKTLLKVLWAIRDMLQNKREKRGKLLVFRVSGHLNLSHTSGRMDFLVLESTRSLAYYRFMIKLKLQISLKTCIMKGFLLMCDFHALSNTLMLLFSVIVCNDPFLEHYMLLSFEMAVKEQAPQKSIQLISVHADALTFTWVDVLPSKWIIGRLKVNFPDSTQFHFPSPHFPDCLRNAQITWEHCISQVICLL
jgi:hypothetical protein